MGHSPPFESFAVDVVDQQRKTSGESDGVPTWEPRSVAIDLAVPLGDFCVVPPSSIGVDLNVGTQNKSEGQAQNTHVFVSSCLHPVRRHFFGHVVECVFRNMTMECVPAEQR